MHGWIEVMWKEFRIDWELEELVLVIGALAEEGLERCSIDGYDEVC